MAVRRYSEAYLQNAATVSFTVSPLFTWSGGGLRVGHPSRRGLKIPAPDAHFVSIERTALSNVREKMAIPRSKDSIILYVS